MKSILLQLWREQAGAWGLAGDGYGGNNAGVLARVSSSHSFPPSVVLRAGPVEGYSLAYGLL